MLSDTSYRGIGGASGVPTEMHLTQLWTVKGGKITRFQSFATREQALEAAALSE